MNTLALNSLMVPLALKPSGDCKLSASIPGKKGLTLAILDFQSADNKVVVREYSPEGEVNLTFSPDSYGDIDGGGIIDAVLDKAASTLTNSTSTGRFFAVLAQGKVNTSQLHVLLEAYQSENNGPLSHLPDGSRLTVESGAEISVEGGYPWCLPDPLERVAWGGYAPVTDLTALLLGCKAGQQNQIPTVSLVCNNTVITATPSWTQGPLASTAFLSNLNFGNNIRKPVEVWWGTVGTVKGIRFMPEEVVNGGTYTAAYPPPMSFQVLLTYSNGVYSVAAPSAYVGQGIPTNEASNTGCLGPT